MNRAVDAWERFWFGPTPTSTLAMLRIGFGVVMVSWTVALTPDLFAFFSRSGLLPEQPVNAGWGLLDVFPGDAAMLAVWAALLVSSICVLVGFLTRLSAAILFIALLSITRRDVLVFNSGDAVLRNLSFFLVFAPAGASLSVDRWLRARDRFWEFPARAPWALRLAQIQLTVIYLASVWAKVRGTTWNDGTAVSYALRLEQLARFPLPGFMSSNVLLVNLLTYGTLAVELGVAILVWNRTLRPWVLAAGACLHLLIHYSIEVGFFTFAMLLLYLAFVPAERSAALLLWSRARMARSRVGPLRRLAAPHPGSSA